MVMYIHVSGASKCTNCNVSETVRQRALAIVRTIHTPFNKSVVLDKEEEGQQQILKQKCAFETKINGIETKFNAVFT